MLSGCECLHRSTHRHQPWSLRLSPSSLQQLHHQLLQYSSLRTWRYSSSRAACRQLPPPHMHSHLQELCLSCPTRPQQELHSHIHSQRMYSRTCRPPQVQRHINCSQLQPAQQGRSQQQAHSNSPHSISPRRMASCSCLQAAICMCPREPSGQLPQLPLQLHLQQARCRSHLLQLQQTSHSCWSNTTL